MNKGWGTQVKDIVQALLEVTGDAGQDLVLQLIDLHCDSFLTGISAANLEKHWAEYGRDQEALFHSVGALLSLGLVAALGEDDAPRFSITEHGYQRIRKSAARAKDAELAAAGGNRRMGPDIRLEDAATLSKFVVTETVLRNAVMDIYRDLEIPRAGEVVASTLVRYWEEKAMPPADLRLALNVLMADGYLDCLVKKDSRYFKLTNAGFEFCTTEPRAELDYEQPKDMGDDKFQDVQREIVFGVFKLLGVSAGEPVPFLQIQREWVKASMRLDDLLKILDSFMKANLLAMPSDNRPFLMLTQEGYKMAKHAGGFTSDKLVRQSLKRIRSLGPKDLDPKD